jgi:N-acetylglucosaminyldiphosphoundecaprenol N-acetyl-beta-D-mannosaminyltransferase
MPKNYQPTGRRANVLGVGVNAYSMEEVLVIISSAIKSGRKGYICATGVHGVMEAQKDANLCAVLNGSLINVPDGRPTVWVGWLQGLRCMSQVTGPNLMLRVCELSLKKGYTHFLYGGNVGVAEKLRDCLVRQFPGLNVVGTYTPPFRPLSAIEVSELSELVSRLKPDIFWVGLSTPKQERFVAEYLHKLDTKLMFAVGAAFDIHIGKIQESPEWVKAIGMQWFHRLCQEPGRLWKRYLLNNPRFVAGVFLQFAGLRKYELAARSASPLETHTAGTLF